MSWDSWPFRPRSLTEMFGPESRNGENRLLVSLLISGCASRLGRPLIALEPRVGDNGEVLTETDPGNPHVQRLQMRRIDPTKPRDQFASFCANLREIEGQDKQCRCFDKSIARKLFEIEGACSGYSDDRIAEYMAGYECRFGLIDQAGVICCRGTPVAVISSGQYLPEGECSALQLHQRIDVLASQLLLSESRVQLLRDSAKQLETQSQYLDRYLKELEQIDPQASEQLESSNRSQAGPFGQAIREIQRVADVQFAMHKREQESDLTLKIREAFVGSSVRDRERLAEQARFALERICEFLHTKYLVLFVSNRQHISYETDANLIPPFAHSGVGSEIMSQVQHFNWRKARRTQLRLAELEPVHASTNNGSDTAGFLRICSRPIHTQAIVRDGIKGDQKATLEQFADACVLTQIQFSPMYRGVLLWGPFEQLNDGELGFEDQFLKEISEVLFAHLLIGIQLSDLDTLTSNWKTVTNLIAHHSRRAMTPVSAAVRIISKHLETGRFYTRADALTACLSLETAVRVIADTVRSPLNAFAAEGEKLYKYEKVELGCLVEACVNLYRPAAVEKHVSISIDRSVELLPRIEADSLKMSEAIGYVVDNAIKYSHEGKQIRIYGDSVDTHVNLYIEDFGQGIAKADDKEIYNREYRGERSLRAYDEEGDGLGLFHALQIVEAHKGNISHTCRSGDRDEHSQRLEGFRVVFHIHLPVSRRVASRW